MRECKNIEKQNVKLTILKALFSQLVYLEVICSKYARETNENPCVFNDKEEAEFTHVKRTKSLRNMKNMRVVLHLTIP